MSEEGSPRVLYVGNLSKFVTEELLCKLFRNIGPVNGTKVMCEPGCDPFALIEFESHLSASTALVAMNGRLFLDKEMVVNWASTYGTQQTHNTSEHYHIFVGGVGPEIETHTLKEAFAPFGEISNCRIMHDPWTFKCRGYAFISFVRRSDAENAIISMNGQYLGNRCLRTNWSTRTTLTPPRALNNYQESAVYDPYNANVSSPNNSTVFCGGVYDGLTGKSIEEVFSRFGTILEIKVFPDKGYSFIKFSSKIAAFNAIRAVHNTNINGYPVICFWGKKTVDPRSPADLAASDAASTNIPTGQYSAFDMNYNEGMNNCYPDAQSYSQNVQGMQATNLGGIDAYGYYTGHSYHTAVYQTGIGQVANGKHMPVAEKMPIGAYFVPYQSQ